MTTATAASSRTTPAAVEFALLQSWLASGSALELPLHEIECRQQEKGREVQRLLLQAHLRQRGNGDVGPALYLQQQDGELLYSHRRLGTRALTTVFGTVELVRMGYSRPGMPGIFPLDRCPRARSLMNSSGAWSKPPCRILSSIPSRPSPT